MGKIEERRNVYFLVELFESLRKKKENIQLVLVGSGEKEYLNAFLEKIRPWTDSGDILYYEKASQKELALIYQRSDMFVFASNYEIFGMVLLESMFFGLPVISSMNGGASVLIRNGINGYIMEHFNVQEWEEKILALAGNKEQCVRMGKNAHETIEKHFLWESLADQFLDAYEEAEGEYERFLKECGRTGKGKRG